MERVENTFSRLYCATQNALYRKSLLRIYGCLGIRSEAAVEKMHQTVNQSNQMLSSVRNYEVKNRSMLTTREAAEVMEVQEITIATLSRVKRPRTPETVLTKPLILPMLEKQEF